MGRAEVESARAAATHSPDGRDSGLDSGCKSSGSAVLRAASLREVAGRPGVEAAMAAATHSADGRESLLIEAASSAGSVGARSLREVEAWGAAHSTKDQDTPHVPADEMSLPSGMAIASSWGAHSLHWWVTWYLNNTSSLVSTAALCGDGCSSSSCRDYDMVPGQWLGSVQPLHSFASIIDSSLLSTPCWKGYCMLPKQKPCEVGKSLRLMGGGGGGRGHNW